LLEVRKEKSKKLRYLWSPILVNIQWLNDGKMVSEWKIWKNALSFTWKENEQQCTWEYEHETSLNSRINFIKKLWRLLKFSH
jgi:hypothetical protein